MADNDLEIRFGADVAGLTAGASQAKSEIDRLVQAIALLQKTVGAAARVMTSELTGALQGVGASAATASTRVKAHGEALENAGKSGHRGASEMSFFTLELRALADEAMSGRWRNFEGSLTRIIGHSAGMIAGFVKANPVVSALGAAAAVAGTSLFFLDRALTEAADASRTIQMDAASNQFFMAKEKADALRDSIRSIANVSAEDAEKIYKPFDKLGEAGAILARMAAEFIPSLTDKEKDLGKVSEEVAKYMLDLGGAGKAFVDESPASTAAIRKQYDEFLASNNKAEAYITILKLLAPPSGLFNALY